MPEHPVPPAEVEHALRRVRAATYRVETTTEGTSLALVMKASHAGRRNAAAKIAGLLTDHGLALDAPEPVEALTGSAEPLHVVRG